MKRALLWSALGLLLAALPLAVPKGHGITILNQLGIAIVFAMSLNLMFGQSGLLSFCHAVFMGLGAFVAIHFLRKVGQAGWPVSSAFVPVVGAAGGMFFGALAGWLAARRSGTAFAMITFGLGELAVVSTPIFRSFFGGEEGISADRIAGGTLIGVEFRTEIQVYYLIAFWTFVAIVGIHALMRTPLGVAAHVIRDNSDRAAFIGYNPARVRLIMFTVSGLVAGLAGGLFAVCYETVTVFSMNTMASAFALFMVVIGGVRSLLGSVLGAVLITLLNLKLPDLTDAWLLYLGLMFVLIVMYAPEGIAGLLEKHATLWRMRLVHRLGSAYAMVLMPAVTGFVGVIIVVELAWRLKLGAERGAVLRLFGASLEATSAVSWSIGLALVAAGVIGLRLALPAFRNRWEALHELAMAQSRQP